MRLTILEGNVTIISGHKQGQTSSQNRKSLGSLIKDVRKLGAQFKFKSGRWRGKKEPSLIVRGLDIEKAKELMKKYDQEVIIHNGKTIHKD